ncbi:PAS domain-containing hybrid sensor histidine kinase/response regulator [Verrucomicrobiota bacterium sgz303538]
MDRRNILPPALIAICLVTALGSTALCERFGILPTLSLNILWTIASLWASAACFRSAYSASETDLRRVWALFGTGCASWFFGQLCWDYQEFIAGHTMPFAGWQDVGYVASAPFFLAGFYFFSGKATTPLAALGRLSNLVLLCCGTATTVLLTNGRSILEQHGDPAFLFSVLAWGVLMPTAFLGGLVFLWLYVPTAYFRPFSLLVLNAGLQAIAMVQYAVEKTHDTYRPGNLGDYLFLVCFGLIIWAAREQRQAGPLQGQVAVRKTIPVAFLEPALPALCMLTMLGVAFWKRTDLSLLFPYMLPVLGILALSVGIRRAWSARVEKQLFEKLHESESRFRQVVDSNMTGIVYGEFSGIITDANHAFLSMIGYSREELSTRRICWNQLTPEEHLPRDQAAIAELKKKQVCEPYEKEYIRKDGTRVPVLVGGALLPDSDARTVFFVIDMSARKTAENALQETQARLHAALDHLPFAFWSMDRSERYMYQNAVSLARWGDQRGKRVEEVGYPPEALDERRSSYQRAFAGEIIRADCSSGEGSSKRWYQRIIVPIKQGAEITGIFGVNVDFTSQKQVQLQLEESEARYRNLAEHSAVGIWHFDGNGRTVYANQNMLGLLGVEWLSDLKNRSCEEYLSPASVAVWADECRKLTQGVPSSFEIELVQAHGALLPVLVSCVPLMHTDGSLQGSIATFTDLSELKRTQRALEHNERRFRALVENTSDGIAAWDAEGIIRYAGPSNTRLVGYTPEELLNRPVCELFHPEDTPAMEEARLRAVHGGRDQIPVKARVRHKNGHWRLCEGVLTNLLDDPAVGALVVNYHDVTERQKAEDALRESEERLQAFMENSPTHMFIKDRAGRYLHTNKGFLEAFGFTPADIIGQTDREVFEPEQAETLISSDEKTLAADRPMRFEEVIVQNGVQRSSIVYKFPLRNAAGEIQGLGGISTDISERVRAEQALRLSEERYRNLVDGARDAIFTLSPEGMLTSANPAAELITGIPNSERLNQPFLPMLASDDAAKAMNAFMRVMSGEKVDPLELMVLGTGGRQILMEFSATPQKDGDKIIGVLGIGRDISERRELEQQLRHSQKMDSVGQLAGGVAHDFNNLLTVIQGNVSLIEYEQDLSPDVLTFVQEIACAADRAAALTRQLLAFSRRQIIQARDLDLNEIIGDITKMLRRLLGEDITLLFESSNNLPLVHADAGMIEQVLLNLVVNARDAMPQGGRLTISTGHVELSEAAAHKNAEARAGHFVRFSVSDTGCGIAPEVFPHLFEPFFTTKDIGKGTGLGLATAYGIVKQHQGWITVQSTTGEGTRFDIFLPVRAREMNPVAPANPPSPDALPHGNETVLVVEDEAPLRNMVKTVLTRLGYCVLEAASAVEALKLWPEHRDSIDLVFTDMVMPDGMSGQQLAEELHKERPGLRILFTSGYSSQMLTREGRLANDAQCLQKPYLPPALAAAIRKALNGTAEMVSV